MGEVDVFARRSETATAQVQVFTRRASGLVRVMSPYSAFAYNILNIGVIFPWVYITTIAFQAGASVWAGILICGIFTSFLAVVYAGLASAMPRTGGDYVFQSRTLRPWLGFATVATMIITFFLQWQALGGWLLSVLGVYPMLTGLGIMTNNQTLIDWGAWYLVGWGPAIVTMVASTIAALILIKSFRWFVKLQWVMWYGFLLSYALMVILFLVTPNATFISRYDRAAGLVGGGSGAYAAILTNAVANSFSPERTLSIAGTILVTPVALTSLGWVGYAQEQAGEIQGAQSLKNQMFINFGGGVVSMIMMAILALVIVQTVDQNWLGAAAYLSFQPLLPQPPIPPWFSSLAIMLTDSPVLLFLMIVGVMLNAIQVVFNVIVGWTRVAVAMSIDGVLPKAVSHVSPRTHTPVYAHVIFLILGGFIFAYVYNLVPGYTTYTLAVTAVATVMYIGTAVGGALFPWTRKEVYATAPIAKFKVGPIPLITICGAIAALFSAIMLYYFLTVIWLVNVDISNPGYSGNLFLYAVVLIFFGWVAYYFIRRAYLRRIGVNLDLAYKEVPPI
ncbi:MAG: APC family permease [Methanobacteriota archaeon]|nr:MAG: APC family permease [Euryarchaeota archaeon]